MVKMALSSTSSTINGSDMVKADLEMNAEQVNGNGIVKKSETPGKMEYGDGANSFREKNGFSKGRGRSTPVRGGGRKEKVENGNVAEVNGANGGTVSHPNDDESLMNGIEEIKISDSMDTDEGSSNDNAIPGTSNGLGSSVQNCNIEISGSNSVIMKKEEDRGNGVVVHVQPPVQKCANGKLACVLDAASGIPCRRCHRVFYCSDDHRQQHYAEHQPDCKTVSSLEFITEDEYSMWLKYAAPHMYDLCLNFILVWPSLTAQWLPDVVELENNILRHHLLLGTMTNQEQNHVLVVGIDVIDRSRTDNASSHAAKYSGSMSVLKRINHEAEVNRARYMPQDSNIIATKSSSPEVFIFDCRKHPDIPEDSTFSPLLRLRGHQKEGFGLCWNGKDTGKILSGSNDGVVCLWDLNGTAAMDVNKGRYLEAYRTFHAHEDVVEDVNWHPEHKHIFASVGDDKRLILWDARVAGPEAAVITRADAHEGDINAVSFSPFSEYCFATGSSDATVAIWDMRNTSKKLHSLEFHRGEVMQVQWSPHSESILSSTGKDNRVFIWDLSKIMKRDPSQEFDEAEAPNELAFVHGGHIATVNDISWNHHDTGMIASVTEDNILQVWKVSEDLQATYVGGTDSDEESQDSLSDVLMDD